MSGDAIRLRFPARPEYLLLARLAVAAVARRMALGRVEVAGLREPVELSELLGTGPARSRLDASATRGLTRFVGRQTESEALNQALAWARTGHG